jgi:transcription antitermination factor NusG
MSKQLVIIIAEVICNMDLKWYALHSHPYKEELLWKQVQANSIECFYPRIRVSPVNPRARKIRPYFPGYLFVHADLDLAGMSVFNWMPYSTGLVSFGSEPAVVSDALIHAIKQRILQVEQAGGELFHGLNHGDRVVVQDGPFEGYEAIFDVRLPGSERVRILLKMLSDRHLPIELRAGQIRKK